MVEFDESKQLANEGPRDLKVKLVILPRSLLAVPTSYPRVTL